VTNRTFRLKTKHHFPFLPEAMLKFRTTAIAIALLCAGTIATNATDYKKMFARKFGDNCLEELRKNPDISESAAFKICGCVLENTSDLVSEDGAFVGQTKAGERAKKAGEKCYAEIVR